MRTKILGLLAIALLVSACATDTEESGSASSEGTSMHAASRGSGGSSAATETMKPMAPKGLAPDSQEYLVVNVGDRVFFALDKSEISSESADTLKRQAAWMRDNPNVTVVIEGHADERGTREYNLALGERRANSIKNFLVELGVAPSRITTISFGKERPVALGSNDAAWAQNRRGVTLVN